MVLEIVPEDLRKVRKRIGITQKQLALSSGVSQSMIAKIESSNAEPSYRVMRELNDALLRSEEERSRKACDIMNADVLSFQPGEKIGKAVRMMIDNGYSQAPVVSGGVSIGKISETSVMDTMFGKNRKKPERVRDSMGESLPTIPSSASSRSVHDILRNFDAVLVTREGSIVGIITRSDMIRSGMLR